MGIFFLSSEKQFPISPKKINFASMELKKKKDYSTNKMKIT